MCSVLAASESHASDGDWPGVTTTRRLHHGPKNGKQKPPRPARHLAQLSTVQTSILIGGMPSTSKGYCCGHGLCTTSKTSSHNRWASACRPARSSSAMCPANEALAAALNTVHSVWRTTEARKLIRGSLWQQTKKKNLPLFIASLA